MLVAAAGIALVARDERLGADVGVAVCVSALFGLGALLALSPDDAAAAAGAAVRRPARRDAGATSRSARRARGGRRASRSRAGAGRWRCVGFDRASARSLGARPARWELALLVLLAVTTVAAVQGLGNLLLFALIVAPAAAALRSRGGCAPRSLTRAALAALAGVAGLLLSFHLDIATGAAVALCAVVPAFAAQLLPARRPAGA